MPIKRAARAPRERYWRSDTCRPESRRHPDRKKGVKRHRKYGLINGGKRMSYFTATYSVRREKKKKRAWSNKYLQTIKMRREERKMQQQIKIPTCLETPVFIDSVPPRRRRREKALKVGLMMVSIQSPRSRHLGPASMDTSCFQSYVLCIRVPRVLIHM